MKDARRYKRYKKNIKNDSEKRSAGQLSLEGWRADSALPEHTRGLPSSHCLWAQIPGLGG